MTAKALRRARLGLGMVLVGLVVQAGASVFWSPAAFILSAAIGAPLVGAGVLVTWLGLGRSGGGEG
jgi:hypothetical protein